MFQEQEKKILYFLFIIKRENPNLGATKQRGGFIGIVDADIKTDKNIVYSVLGAQGSFEIDSKGNII